MNIAAVAADNIFERCSFFFMWLIEVTDHAMRFPLLLHSFEN